MEQMVFICTEHMYRRRAREYCVYIYDLFLVHKLDDVLRWMTHNILTLLVTGGGADLPLLSENRAVDPLMVQIDC